MSNVYICEITTTILIQNSSITRFFVLFSYSQSQLLFSPYQTPAIITNLFSTLIILSLQECCVNKNHTVCNILRVNLFSLRSLFLKLESIRCEIVCSFVCLKLFISHLQHARYRLKYWRYNDESKWHISLCYIFGSLFLVTCIALVLFPV